MKKFFYLLMALPLLFVACDGKEPTPQPTPEKASLTLTSDEVVEFDAEGGEDTITFTYDGGTITGNDSLIGTNGQLEVSCDAEWIDVPSAVDLLGSIEYTVAKNETADAREAKIVASIDDLSFEVTVKQAAALDTPEPEPSFEGWGIIGTMNEWSVANAIVMEEANGYYVAKGVALTADDKFKFVKDGDNAQNRGGNGLVAEPNYYYTAQLWGSDIHTSEAGTYDIYLNNAEDTYYIMSEGKSPADALEPLAPGESRWDVAGNFEGDGEHTLYKEDKYRIAKGVKFTEAVTAFTIRKNENEAVYGAKEELVRDVEQVVSVAEGSQTPISVNVEVGAEYDIYFRDDLLSLWIMPAGIVPTIWKEVTGVAFDNHNFGVFLIAEGLVLNFDFNCGEEAVNSIIPEGTYYVDNPENDGGNNFNLDYCDMKVNGAKTFLLSGTMTIKHISGGYDITVDMKSINQHSINVHYAGPIGEISIMGRPITNPE